MKNIFCACGITELRFQDSPHFYFSGQPHFYVSLDVMIETCGYAMIGVLDIFIKFYIYFTEKPGML